MVETNKQPELKIAKFDESYRQLAHDMRSSLSVLSMGLQMLRDSNSDNSEITELCDMMLNHGTTPLTAQVDQVVKIAKDAKTSQSL